MRFSCSLRGWMHHCRGRRRAASSSTAWRTYFIRKFRLISSIRYSLLCGRPAASGGHIFQVLTKRPGRAVAWWRTSERRLSLDWPSNIWIGTSVENQKYAPRLAVLARLPAPVRFVSDEPLLDSVDLRPWLDDGVLQWVIVGGESGPRARPMELNWARELRDQSTRAGVPFFLKQLGGKRGKRAGAEAVLDGRSWQEYPQNP